VGDREEVDRVLSLIRSGSDGDSLPRVRIERSGGNGVTAMTVNRANSNLVFSDDKGSLELTIKDGQKTLVAKNAKGEQMFSGPVSTPEQRSAMPAEVRDRLEKLESMHNMTFRTDGDFQGAETKVIQPPGR